MHRKVDGAIEQRLLDFLGEQPLAAGFRERPVLDVVPGGADRDELDPGARKPVGCEERRANELGLFEGQRAAARADPQNP